MMIHVPQFTCCKMANRHCNMCNRYRATPGEQRPNGKKSIFEIPRKRGMRAFPEWINSDLSRTTQSVAPGHLQTASCRFWQTRNANPRKANTFMCDGISCTPCIPMYHSPGKTTCSCVMGWLVLCASPTGPCVGGTAHALCIPCVTSLLAVQLIGKAHPTQLKAVGVW